MGRAYAVREKKIKETGAKKGKLYTTYAKEIYLVAKRGGTEVESNMALKHLVDKAKKDQVPQDVIKRAIDKAKGAGKDEYEEIMYEGFGPGASTFMIKTLTDNVNRTVGEVRAAFNKKNKSLGLTNSVSYNYDNLTVLAFKAESEDDVLMCLLDNEIEPVELEYHDGVVELSIKYQDTTKTKEALEKLIPSIEYDVDESGWYAKEMIYLSGEDLDTFNIIYNLLDDIDDVTNIYTNVVME